MVADDTNLNPDTNPDDDTEANESTEYSLKSRHDALVAAMTTKDNAGVALESAAQTREMATAGRGGRFRESNGVLPAVGGSA